MRKWKAFLILCSVWPVGLWAQLPDSVRMDSVRQRLDRIARTDPEWNTVIDLSSGKLALADLLRNVARANEVNLCLRGEVMQTVACNFNRVRITDLLFFLCREYRLNLETVGNIVTVYQEPQPLLTPPRPLIRFDTLRQSLSYDLKNCELAAVFRQITLLTGINFVVPRDLYSRPLSGYLNDMPLAEALQTLARANNFDILQEKNGAWTLASLETANPVPAGVPANRPSRFRRSAGEITVDSNRLISVVASGSDLQAILTEVCNRLHLDHVFISPVNQQMSVYVKGMDLLTLLQVLFTGTKYSYRVENGVYLLGALDEAKTLSTDRVIPMKYRTIDGLPALIPEMLKTGVQISPFPEQNSLVVSGDTRQIERIAAFLEKIDRSVPLITIEILIVDSKKSVIQEAGLTMGLGDGPEKTTFSTGQGFNASLTASSINKLLNSFSSFGSVNLGRVTPEFYLNLKLLEEVGNIELRSTPKLATLNGHEATLKSGETQYYKEVQNNIISSQTPIQSESYTWKSVEANLSVKIIPTVSEDDHITLNIGIEQTEFTAREKPEAPPGTATRSFQSLIRVKNGEMVLLGGIERNQKDKTSGGLPFIARVPVLKWIFGNSRNNKMEEKLNVFIKPQVTY